MQKKTKQSRLRPKRGKRGSPNKQKKTSEAELSKVSGGLGGVSGVDPSQGYTIILKEPPKGQSEVESRQIANQDLEKLEEGTYEESDTSQQNAQNLISPKWSSGDWKGAITDTAQNVAQAAYTKGKKTFSSIVQDGMSSIGTAATHWLQGNTEKAHQSLSGFLDRAAAKFGFSPDQVQEVIKTKGGAIKEIILKNGTDYLADKIGGGPGDFLKEARKVGIGQALQNHAQRMQQSGGDDNQLIQFMMAQNAIKAGASVVKTVASKIKGKISGKSVADDKSTAEEEVPAEEEQVSGLEDEGIEVATEGTAAAEEAESAAAETAEVASTATGAAEAGEEGLEVLEGLLGGVGLEQAPKEKPEFEEKEPSKRRPKKTKK